MPATKGFLPFEAVQFEPIGHRYFVHGREVPSVTRVLSDAGFFPADQTYYPMGSGDRGRRIHAHIREINLGSNLILSPILRDEAGPVAAWQHFIKQTNLEVDPNMVERPLGCLQYAGTIDVVGTMTAPNGVPRKAVIDPKSGPAFAWHLIQAAAYAKLIDEPVERWIVYLGEDGVPQVVQGVDPLDGNAFLAALTLFQWRQRYLGREGGSDEVSSGAVSGGRSG